MDYKKFVGETEALRQYIVTLAVAELNTPSKSGKNLPLLHVLLALAELPESSGKQKVRRRVERLKANARLLIQSGASLTAQLKKEPKQTVEEVALERGLSEEMLSSLSNTNG